MNDFKVIFLGGFQLMAGDRHIDDFQTKKSTQLLGYLILHPERSHSREPLAEVIGGSGAARSTGDGPAPETGPATACKSTAVTRGA